MSAPAPAIAIMGPTGSGKSALALRLAAVLPVEIISVDSAQVYRGMDIGTAKPSQAERAAVPHHLIDIREPEGVYSAGEFRDDALRLAGEIHARGRVPLLVGGTMLYFRALFHGIAALPTADAGVRAAIDAEAARQGWSGLHRQLSARDPQAAARIHPHDAQRIQRAFEVMELSGHTLTDHWAREQAVAAFGEWRICLLEPARRELLHERLARRLDAMVAAGFAEEVSNLLKRGTLSEHSPALRLVGYRQLLAYCLGRETLQAAAEKALQATRQLAKRQLTWLRSQTLLPSGVRVSRVDPFDTLAMERMPGALIQGFPTP